MNRNKEPRPPAQKKISTLIVLVLFVFIVLLVSIVLAGLVFYFFMRLGILPALLQSRFPVVLIFLLLVSLLIGTVLAALGADYMLRPLHHLNEATRQIAAGNFAVRVKPSGTRELIRLAMSFNEMAEELSGIETLSSDFVGNISHEFKTPVVSIRGFARRLKKSTLEEEKRIRYLDAIIAESERLSRLSSNVLLLSRLDSMDKAFECTAFSLDEQLRRTVLLLEPLLEKKQLQMEIELPAVTIHAQEEMLSHVWTNLLSNAIKFSPEGSTITVSLQEQEDRTIVSIADQGIGMDEQTQRRIYDRFFQGDQSRATEGNGLGLSLVKKILQLCNGRIEVQSKPGRGACFRVSLPVQ